MAFIDYYKILGVTKDIPQKDVKRAYLKRTKQFHPDLHPDDPKAKAKFQALTEAYDVIGDPEKRRKYDQYGEQWRQADAFSGAGSSSGNPFEGFDFSRFGSGRGGGFSSFFEQLFGGRRVNTGEMQAAVSIDMYTALLGGEVVIQMNDGTRLRLKVKPGTQPGAKVRLRGKGYDRGDGTFGDLIITYQVELPTALSARQRELLRQMQTA
jgi:curved DNA-binding protein